MSGGLAFEIVSKVGDFSATTLLGRNPAANKDGIKNSRFIKVLFSNTQWKSHTTQKNRRKRA
jgi:hypothetical protein